MGLDIEGAFRALGISGAGAAVLALGWSLVRKRIASDNAAADQSRGESNWIKRQQDEIADKEAANKLLLAALHDRDETISALRLREALHDERDKRSGHHIRLLQDRLRRLGGEDDDAWMTTDNSALGPPEV